jgi:hypothetical protein
MIQKEPTRLALEPRCLECGEFSLLLAGDLSPSSVGGA